MNFAKGILGSLFLASAFFIEKTRPADINSVLFLAISGIVGIALGDTFFFISLKYLGARLASLTGTLTPVSIALFSVIFLKENPSLFVWLGIFLTTAGVIYVLRERLPAPSADTNQALDTTAHTQRALGIFYRLLSIICTTVGIILAKKGITGVPALQATFIRLSASIPVIFLWACFTRQLNPCLAPLRDISLFKNVLFVVFVVVFGGFWLSLLALKYIDASIVGALNATSPIFILPIAAVMLKEKISKKAVFGTIIAVAGVVFILLGS